MDAGDKESLIALIPEYCGSYRVVLVQLLGQGEADPPRQDQSLLDNARDVAAVARTLGGRVTGIGLSRASNMLVNAALEKPGLFDRLVLVSVPADDGVEGSRFPRPTGFIADYRAAVAVEDWHEIQSGPNNSSLKYRDLGTFLKFFFSNSLRIIFHTFCLCPTNSRCIPIDASKTFA